MFLLCIFKNETAGSPDKNDNKLRLTGSLRYYPVYLLFFLVIIATVRYPFFWDTIQLASKHAGYFYESDFRIMILPNEIDSGHIPFLGIYLALAWKLFGRSLLVSHLAILPFVAGILWQSKILVGKLFPASWQPFALAILLFDPTLMAQCTLVSPDVLLVFFFLLAVNSLISKKKVVYSLALTGLTFASTRGMMVVAGLFVSQMVFNFFFEKNIQETNRWRSAAKRIPHIMVSYLPAIAVAFTFLGWHYLKTGWIGYHKDMPWYEFFEQAGVKGAFRNLFILGWRLADFGRVFIWLTGAVCLRHYIQNRPELTLDIKYVSVILVFVSMVLFQAVILHKNLSGHRYLLPVYILFSLLVSGYLFNSEIPAVMKKAAAWLMIIGLLTGNLWIYPDQISKGWDSTLAYLPYFPLREKMIKYMEEEHIPVSETGTLFPNEGRLDYIDLSGRQDSFAALDLTKNRYVFYSNVFNGFSDDQLSELKNNWVILKSYKRMGVKIILYRTPGSN